VQFSDYPKLIRQIAGCPPASPTQRSLNSGERAGTAVMIWERAGAAKTKEGSCEVGELGSPRTS